MGRSTPPPAATYDNPLQGCAVDFDTTFKRVFYHYGYLNAKNPLLFIIVPIVIALGLTVGWVRIDFIQAPEKLWVPTSSPIVKQKNIFDETFSPYYRIEQFIVSNSKGGDVDIVGALPVIHDIIHTLNTTNSKNMTLATIGTHNNSNEVSLGDLCFRAQPGKGCYLVSPWGWFQNDYPFYEKVQAGYYNSTKHMKDRGLPFNPTDAADWIGYCVVNQNQQDCMDSNAFPVLYTTVMGKYQLIRNETTGRVLNLKTNSFITTIMLMNYDNKDWQDNAAEWEKEVFVKTLQAAADSAQAKGLRITFMAQRSVQDALDSEKTGDISTIVIAYLVMFLYISIALGRFSAIHSKVLLAFVGIFVVILSISSSSGFLALIGIKATLIISEVIPFLILAIGVDNMFIINNQYFLRSWGVKDQFSIKKLSNEEIAVIVGVTLADVGPSIILAAGCESLAFFLGVLAKMPAVTAFSIYSGAAVLVNVCLQMTVFVAALCLDARRVENRRYDILPCIQAADTDDPPEDMKKGVYLCVEEKTPSEILEALDGPMDDETSLKKAPPPSIQGWLRHFIRKFYAPVVTSKFVRYPVLVIFFVVSLLSILYTSKHLQYGLDQADAVPKTHYLYGYFKDEAKDVRVGPLSYFVTYGLDFHDPAVQRNLTTWHTEILKTAYIDINGINEHWWLGDFMEYLCFKSKPNDPHSPSTCETRVNLTTSCSTDPVTGDTIAYIPPEKFYNWLSLFLTKKECCLIPVSNSKVKNWKQRSQICGFQYYSDVIFKKDKHGNVTGINGIRLKAQSTALYNQSDYILSLQSARNVSTWGANSLSLKNAFAYSLYYVYFTEYADLPETTGICVVVALTAVCICTGALMWSLSLTMSILTCITMIVIDMFAIMSSWGILLNAVSLVNVVMTIGISVEFCVHIAREFLYTPGVNNADRMRKTLVNMGSNVWCGITLTKMSGIIVLNFSHSQIFQIYYFRMLLSMVGLGAIHGLLVLPSLLIFVGPPCRTPSLPPSGEEANITATAPKVNASVTSFGGRNRPGVVESDASFVEQ